MADDLNLDTNLDLDLDMDLDLGNLDIDFDSPVERDVGAFEAGSRLMGAGLAQFFAGDGDDNAWYNKPIAELMGLADEGEVQPWAKEFQEIADKQWTEYKKYKPSVASYKDIESAGDLLDYAGENIALSAPQLASLFLGPAAVPLLGAQATGTTYLEQGEKGDQNFRRALMTGALEGALALPLTKQASSIIKSIGNTELDEAAKKSLTGELIQGIATDIGVNGLQQIVRNYGVEGEISLDNVDEAIVAGVVSNAPLRGTAMLTNRYVKAQVAQEASNVAAKKDLADGDGIIQSFTNFTVGTALRPVRRITAFAEGTELFKRIDNMRNERELMAYSLNDRVENLFKRVKDEESFREAYARGDRSNQELVELASIMNEVHARANKIDGANLKIGTINNYLPTLLTADSFTPEMKTNLLNDYTNWFNSQPANIKKNLVKPSKARRQINSYEKKAKAAAEGTATKLPKVTIDNNGNITAPPRVDVRSPLKAGQLEHSRMLGFIPQDILMKYSNNQRIKDQIKQYIFSAAQRITYAEQLGKNNESLNALVSLAGKQMNKEGKPLTKVELDTIYNALDAYQGVYGQFENANVRKLGTLFRAATNVVALPLTLLSSLTEPFNLAIKVGNVQAGKAFVAALKSTTQDLMSALTNGFVPRSEVNKQLKMTGRAFRDATTALNNRINGDHMSAGVQKFNNVFFHLTGQTAMNYLVNSMAAHAAQYQVKNDIQIVNSMKGTRAYNLALGRLNDLGISEGMAQQIHKRPSMMKGVMPSVITRFNRDVALNPEALDKPLWMSTGWGAMFGQLRGYPTMFTNSVLPKFLDMVDPRGKTVSEIAINSARFLSTVGAIISLGFLQESIKNEFKGGTSNDDEILVKAIRNTITPIQVGYVLDIATGKAARVVQPAAFGILDSQTRVLEKATQGEVKLEDLPIFKSFKGVL